MIKKLVRFSGSLYGNRNPVDIFVNPLMVSHIESAGKAKTIIFLSVRPYYVNLPVKTVARLLGFQIR
jgi:hypothetical protein